MEPDPSATSSLLTNTAYVYSDATSSVSVHQTTYLNSTTLVDSYTYYDGLRRVKQTRKSAEFGNYETKDLAYNNIGLLQQGSLPYFSASSANTTATSNAALFTTYAYAALQRTVTTANAVGTTTQTYVNWKTTITDANGKKKDLFNDAYGNLIEVNEHNASSTYVTAYTYNGLNALTNLIDALGNVRNFTYDGLGTGHQHHRPSLQNRGMEMWKTKPVSHISTPPTATTAKGQKRRYTNIPLGTTNRSGHPPGFLCFSWFPFAALGSPFVRLKINFLMVGWREGFLGVSWLPGVFTGW